MKKKTSKLNKTKVLAKEGYFRITLDKDNNLKFIIDTSGSFNSSGDIKNSLFVDDGDIANLKIVVDKALKLLTTKYKY